MKGKLQICTNVSLAMGVSGQVQVPTVSFLNFLVRNSCIASCNCSCDGKLLKKYSQLQDLIRKN